MTFTPSLNKEPRVRKECVQWNQVSWVQSSSSWPHYGTLSELLTGQEESPHVHFPKFQAKILGCIYITDDQKIYIFSLNNRHSQHHNAGQGLFPWLNLLFGIILNSIKTESKCWT